MTKTFRPVSDEDQAILIRLFGPHWAKASAEREPHFRRALSIEVRRDVDAAEVVNALLDKVVHSGIGTIPAGWSWSGGELVVWGFDFASAARILEAA